MIYTLLDLQQRLAYIREQNNIILSESIELIDSFQASAIKQAKDEFRAFFECLLQNIKFIEINDGLTASWHNVPVSFKILDPENRFLELLPAFEITFGGSTKRISAFDMNRLPLFDTSIFYRINNLEHMIRCAIDKQIAIRAWLILINSKSLSDLKIGFGQMIRYNPTNFGYVHSKLSDLLRGWYGVPVGKEKLKFRFYIYTT